jgi:hypothetical protein
MNLKTENGGVVKDTTKKEEKRKLRKKERRWDQSTRERGQPYFGSRVYLSSLHVHCKNHTSTKFKERVSQRLLLVPIHRDNLMNMKTENGGVVKGHKKN